MTSVQPDTIAEHVLGKVAHARAITGDKKSYHTNMIRLIKGGHIVACEVAAPPPVGSNAHRDAPYSDRFLFLKAGRSCPAEIEPSNATFQGARHRKR